MKELKLEVTVEVREGYVLVTASGEFEVAASVDAFPRALVACRKSGLNGMLVDFRGIENEIVLSQEVVFAIGISELYRQHLAKGGCPLRIAFLGQPRQIRSWAPGQEVAAANGLETLMTDQEEAAVGWLGA